MAGPRPSAVAFDLDDTLVDHERAARAAISAWLTERGWTTDDAGVADRWIALERQHFADFVAGRVDFVEHRRRRLRAILDVVDADANRADDALDVLFEEYRDRYVRHWRLFDDVLPALRRLRAKGIPVALLTNGQSGQQHEKVRRTGLAPYVDLLLTVADVPAPKPDPRAFATLCELLRVPPAHVVFVGDDLEVDVEGALAAGLRAVHLDRTGSAVSTDRHPAVRTLADLAAVAGLPS